MEPLWTCPLPSRLIHLLVWQRNIIFKNLVMQKNSRGCQERTTLPTILHRNIQKASQKDQTLVVKEFKSVNNLLLFRQIAEDRNAWKELLKCYLFRQWWVEHCFYKSICHISSSSSSSSSMLLLWQLISFSHFYLLVVCHLDFLFQPYSSYFFVFLYLYSSLIPPFPSFLTFFTEMYWIIFIMWNMCKSCP